MTATARGGWDLRLLDAAGRPLAGALASVAEAPVPVPELGLVSDEAGRLCLRPAAAGRWRLRVWHDGHAHELTLSLPDGVSDGAPERIVHLPDRGA